MGLMSKKYTAAISDTDILINLAKVGRLDILEKIFEKVIVPYFVYDKELRFKAKVFFYHIENYIKNSTVFEIKNREDDFILNTVAKIVINDKKKSVGPGESECAGYASALDIPIIISDNCTEFKFLDEYILLTHNNILVLCVHFEYISMQEAEDIFNKINNMLSHPTKIDFITIYTRSMSIFKSTGWNEYLGL